MKTLDFNQLENYQGGQTQRDCLVRGITVSVLAFTGIFFAPAWVGGATVLGTSANCF